VEGRRSFRPISFVLTPSASFGIDRGAAAADVAYEAVMQFRKSLAFVTVLIALAAFIAKHDRADAAQHRPSEPASNVRPLVTTTASVIGWHLATAAAWA
jgi:hypothetical protein